MNKSAYIFHAMTNYHQTGSSATKYQKHRKQKLDAGAAESSVRGPGQVLACSLFATLAALLHVYYHGEEQIIHFAKNGDDEANIASYLACAIIAHHATCCADTLASELGMLVSASDRTVLVTQPWIAVPRGTNGGVTLGGFVWSFIGGAWIGFGAFVCDAITLGGNIDGFYYLLQMIAFGGITGLFGSLLDSILGATVQATYYNLDHKMVCDSDHAPRKEQSSEGASLKHIAGRDILTNAQVNFVSIFLCMVASARYIGPMIFV